MAPGGGRAGLCQVDDFSSCAVREIEGTRGQQAGAEAHYFIPITRTASKIVRAPSNPLPSSVRPLSPHRLLLLKPPSRCPSSFPFDQRHLESKSCLPHSLQPPTFLFESVHPLFIFPHSTAPSNPSSPPEFPAPAPLTPINNLLFVSKTFPYRFNRQEHYFQHAKRDEADIEKTIQRWPWRVVGACFGNRLKDFCCRSR